MDIQRINTALLRSILDNAYLAVIRGWKYRRPTPPRRRSMISWSRVPAASCAPRCRARELADRAAIAGEIFPGPGICRCDREWRTGVNRQAQGLDANALQNTSATAAMQVYNAARRA